MEAESLILLLSENFNLSHGILLKLSAVVAFISAYNRFIKNIKGKLVELINQAESEYGKWDHSGKLKHDWVMNHMKEKRPWIFKIFLSDMKMSRMLDETFENLTAFANLKNETHHDHDTPEKQVMPNAMPEPNIESEQKCKPEPLHTDYSHIAKENDFLEDAFDFQGDHYIEEGFQNISGASRQEPYNNLPPIQFRVEHRSPSEIRVTIWPACVKD